MQLRISLTSEGQLDEKQDITTTELTIRTVSRDNGPDEPLTICQINVLGLSDSMMMKTAHFAHKVFGEVETVHEDGEKEMINIPDVVQEMLYAGEMHRMCGHASRN